MAIHLQKSSPNWKDALRCNARILVKAVDEGALLVEAKQANPNCFTLLRHCEDSFQVFGGDWATNLLRADAWFKKFIDGTFIEKYAPFVDAISEYNEYVANSNTPEELAERVMSAEAMAYTWKTKYRSRPELAHIRLVIVDAAVGNWIDKRFAEIAIKYDCIIGYHPYTLWQNGVRWDGDWLNLSGLWDVMYDEWDLDKWPDILFTEAGPFESAVTGWRSKVCLDANQDKLIDAMRQFVFNTRKTKAFERGCVLATPACFTTGGGDRWAPFELGVSELVRLSAMYDEEWEMVDIVAPSVPANMPVYSQRDPRWSGDLLGYSSLTIGGYGCALTSAAMLAAIVDPSINPGSLNKRLQDAGGFSSGYINWGKVAEIVPGLDYVAGPDWQLVPADIEQVFSALALGPVVIWVDYYPATAQQDSHFVIAYAKNGDDDVWIVDPWNGQTCSLKAVYAQQTWNLARAVYGMRQYSWSAPAKPVIKIVVPSGLDVDFEISTE